MPLIIPNDLRVRVGLAANDASRDAEITAAWESGKAIAEAYCDRKFSHGIDAESFTHVSEGTISLHRYPVNSITSIDIETPYHLEAKTGLIHFDGLAHAHKITVVYEGGYTTLPADLEFALLTVFDAAWGFNTGAGIPVASGGIKTVRAGDLSVTYESGGAAAAASAGGFGGLIAPSAASILDLYARKKA